MSKKSVYEVIEKEKEARTSLISRLKEKLKKAKEDQAAAEADQKKALEAGNIDAFKSAKANERKAADEAEFYKMQLVAAETQPLFRDAEERKAKTSAIRKNAAAVKAERMEAIAKHLKEVAKAIEEVRAETIRANAALEEISKGTGKLLTKIDVISLNGLSANIRSALNHTDLKPYL